MNFLPAKFIKRRRYFRKIKKSIYLRLSFLIKNQTYLYPKNYFKIRFQKNNLTRVYVIYNLKNTALLWNKNY